MPKTDTATNADLEEIYRWATNTPLAPLTLRVGVVGHRKPDDLPLEAEEEVGAAVRNVFADIRKELESIHGDPIANKLYDTQSPPVLRLVSSLAEGADRLCVRDDVVGGEFELAVLLPLPREVFLRYSSPEESLRAPGQGTVAEFEALLAKAGHGSPQSRVLEMDVELLDPASAQTGTEPELTPVHNSAFRLGSQMIVDKCDLIIAVFDGKEDDGPGTSAAVQYARQSGVPMIVIPPGETNNITILNPASSDGRQPAEQAVSYEQAQVREILGAMLLYTHLNTTPLAPGGLHRQLTKIPPRIDAYVSESIVRFDDEAEDSEPDFDDAGPIALVRKHNRWIPPIFNLLKNIFSKSWNDGGVGSECRPEEEDTQLRSESEVLHTQYAAYLRADRMANFYALNHRSTFIWIYLLGAFAVSAAVLSLVCADRVALFFVAAELVALVIIWSLYRHDHGNRVHRRWLEYRALAELLRGMPFISLASAGFGIRSLYNPSQNRSLRRIQTEDPGSLWVYVYAQSILRWTGFAGQRLDQKKLYEVRDAISGSWLKGQLGYHGGNAKNLSHISHRLEKIGRGLFFLTAIIVVVKLYGKISHDISEDVLTSLGALVAVLPAVASMMLAIRSHAEFEISARRSNNMELAIRLQLDKLNALGSSVDDNLASDFARKNGIANEDMTPIPMDYREFVTTLRNISTEMQEDTFGWLDIYELKRTDPT